jgi:16S rRNA (adenine(1408)-N(1))-methyltransferase
MHVGIDACAAGLAAMSARAARKPAKGGAANVLFLRAAVEELPGPLEGVADQVTVILPWGSLLAGVARGDRAVMEALRGLCAPGASLTIVFGYDEGRDASEIRRLGLPRLDDAHVRGTLSPLYEAAGIHVTGAATVDLAARRAIPSSWAQRLGGAARGYHRIDGEAI